MAMEMKEEDRHEIIMALEREVVRLESLVSAYSRQKRSTNAAIAAMAEEGHLNMGERIKRLKALLFKLRGDTTGRPLQEKKP